MHTYELTQHGFIVRDANGTITDDQPYDARFPGKVPYASPEAAAADAQAICDARNAPPAQ